jgi:Tol biopolymer transport system component
MKGGNIMKNKRFLFLAAFMVTLITVTGFQDSPQYKILFEKAKFTMETKGDLNGAIDMFNEIIKKYPKEREYAAKSQLYIGLCYEKLGLEEAQKAYRKVLDNYPEQKQEVAMARENLNRLLASMEVPHKPTFRKINIPTQLTPSVKLSPDGKMLAFVIEKKLWILPLSGNLGHEFPGTPSQVNTEGIMVEWSGLSWSGDGKLIAFNDIPSKVDSDKELFQSIYVVNPADGDPKEVINNYRDWRVVNYRMSLSPEGKKLAYTSVENNKQYIYTKDVSGGVQKKLVDNQAREPVYSPDGKRIAYVEDKSLGSEGGNLWIIPENGRLPKLVAEARNATSPVWSPDGNIIAFLDNEDKKQINFVQLQEASQITNKLTSIEAPPETEEIFLLSGWTSDNRIGLLLVTKRQSALYTLPSSGGPATILMNQGSISHPRWSPDGKQIFYVSRISNGDGQTARSWLASVPATGGSGQIIPEDKNRETLWLWPYYGGNRVSPDGTMIVSSAMTSKDTSSLSPNFPRFKLWKNAIDGTKSEQITNKPGPYADLYPSWSPDGQQIAFLRGQISSSGGEELEKADICIVNASGGEPEILLSTTTKYIMSPVWSPNGKMIAYFSKESEEPHTSYMNIINLENGETRIVGEVPDIYVSSDLAWSPDSKRIAFNYNEVIKIMNVDDGNIEDIKTNLEGVNTWHFDWSPDGDRFVFTGYKGGDLEFWFLEDFLPLLK